MTKTPMAAKQGTRKRVQENVIINRLRLKQLSLLAALGQTHNLHSAAKIVSVTQPTATKMLVTMEESFGFPLFERLPKGMRPTELGAEVVTFATRMMADIGRFTEDLNLKRDGGYGQLIVGAIMGAAPDLVAKAVAEMKSKRPLLHLRVMGETSDQVAALLERRELDIAVGRFSTLLQHNLFDFEELAFETLYVVSRTDHPLARKKDVSLNDLQGMPWILQSMATPGRQVLEQEFFESNMNTPNNTVECGSIFATLQLLQATDAVTVLPESVVRDHLRGNMLVRLPIELKKKLSGFGILTRKDEALIPAAEDFAEALRKYAAILNRKSL